MASAPPVAPAAQPVRRRRRPRPWQLLLALGALALLAAVGNGLWQRRVAERSLVVDAPAQQQGQVSVAITYVASLDRYPAAPDVPAWVQPVYLRSPAAARRLFDQAYGFFVPHFRFPGRGARFIEIVGTGRAPVGSQPGFGPAQSPVLGAGGAPTRLEQMLWTEPRTDGVYRLRLLFSLPVAARVADLTLTIGSERFVLSVPEP